MAIQAVLYRKLYLDNSRGIHSGTRYHARYTCYDVACVLQNNDKNMKMTYSTEQAIDHLLADEYAGWTVSGARALVEYLESIEEDTQTSIDLDRVALRCEYSEYKNAVDAYSAYNTGTLDLGPDEEMEDKAILWLEERTTVIPFDGTSYGGTNGVIIQQF